MRNLLKKIYQKNVAEKTEGNANEGDIRSSGFVTLFLNLLSQEEHIYYLILMDDESHHWTVPKIQIRKRRVPPEIYFTTGNRFACCAIVSPVPHAYQ